ncbi:hypothetical protein [Deinococcus sp.]|uniref:hypothetical protein n=1 Tax=Deinococcus sp. TaxID=47478 RepID=UPI003CC5D26C
MRVCVALALLALAGPVSAVKVQLRPQTPELEVLVQNFLKELSSAGNTLTLDKSAGPILALGGEAAFNPDLSARTFTAGTDRRIEFNPAGPLPLKDALNAELAKELGLYALTPEAARLRFSGADLNGDGQIDTADLAMLMGNFGQTGSNLRGDLNGDGHIDDLDLNLFSAQYKLP